VSAALFAYTCFPPNRAALLPPLGAGVVMIYAPSAVRYARA
jgi:hypothetical protein